MCKIPIDFRIDGWMRGLADSNSSSPDGSNLTSEAVLTAMAVLHGHGGNIAAAIKATGDPCH